MRLQFLQQQVALEGVFGSRSAGSDVRAAPGCRRCRSDSSCRRLPQRPKRRSSSACAERAQVGRRWRCPARPAVASMTLPTPGRRPTGSGARNASTWCGRITNRPSGLRQSEAILARNLFGATPAEAVSCVSSRIALRIASAVAVAVARPVLVVGDVEVGLVQRQRLDQVGVAGEDLAHLARHRPVAHEVRRHEHRLRAQALGAHRRHRRAHAELARLVDWPRRPPSARRARPRPPAARAGPGRRAARPTRRRRPCRRGGSCGWRRTRQERRGAHGRGGPAC